MSFTLVFDRQTGAINPNVVVRDADGASIPNDPRNADWATYQTWLAAGNVANTAHSASGTTVA